MDSHVLIDAVEASLRKSEEKKCVRLVMYAPKCHNLHVVVPSVDAATAF